jgi:hypothetical protein
MSKVLFFVLILAILIAFGCTRESEIASYNLSYEADSFKVIRRVVFYNGITGDYILVVEGRCSINVDVEQKQLELTVKTGKNEYKKHFLGISDNVTYFAEQLDSAKIDTYHYSVVFRPSVILPTVNIE